MELEIITIYCLNDEFLRAINYKDDPQSVMTTAEVMTTAFAAARYYSGKHEDSRDFLKEYGYIPSMLSKSRFNRRLHSIPVEVWQSFLELLAQIAHSSNPLKTYLIDSFPVPVCCNIRIKRCQIYQEEQFRGWNESKKEYFYGLKVHLLISETGIPVEFLLSPGNYSDTSSLYDFPFNLPEGAYVHGGKAYNAYEMEDQLDEEKQIHLRPIRKKNSQRNYDFSFAQGIRYIRKRIESTFSCIQQWFPKHIHAVTHRGFELKILLFVLTYGIHTAIL
jgi:IS5 family transposase